MKSIYRLFLISVILTAVPAAVFAYAPDFPENDETRRNMRELITAPTSDVLASGSEIVQQVLDGGRVKFQVRTQNDSFYLLFINEINDMYPLYGRGSYIIKRNLEDGEFVQIKVFLNNSSDCFVRIYPMSDRAEMEIVMYGRRVYSGINLPFRFADALTCPFLDIIDATAGAVDWKLLLPDLPSALFDVKAGMVDEIRRQLPLMNDADDGALDHDGRWVYIETLGPQSGSGFNCSGFVKWVADGIYFSDAGKYMSISALKEKNLDERGHRWSDHHEDDRDPYFGLDWTRNIASTIVGARHNGESGYKDNDVRSLPWSEWAEDVGFPIEDLKLVMYYLAVSEPQYLYLASVNIPWGTAPILRQHIHTAVLIPVIDQRLGFKDIVMERNFESDVDSLQKRYPGAHVNLVRIRPDAGYKFPELMRKRELGLENFLRR